MKKPHQGEILLLLANRSGLAKTDIAHGLDIHPGHLSKLFKSEILTSKIKKGAAMLFRVDELVFDGGVLDEVPVPLVDVVSEPVGKYEKRRVEEMSVAEIFRYLEEKDRRHYEERARLLGIIENLTKK